MPPLVLRRFLTPVAFALLCLLAVGFSIGVVVGLFLGLFGRRRRPLRIVMFLLMYCIMELTVLVQGAWLWVRHAVRAEGHRDERWRLANERLVRQALDTVLSSGARYLRFRVEIDPSSIPGDLSKEAPVLVLARHAGPGDSFSIVHLLLTHYGRHVRVVLKDVLQLDPAIDILLNRVGCVFVNRRRERTALAMRQLGREAGSRDALLLFPEGANWTPRRWRVAIRRLWTDRKLKAARAAALMDHVLPPRPAGVLACLEDRPDFGVVMVAHAGLDRIVTVGEGWRQLPFNRPMTVRIWPASPPPPTEEDRLAWLTTEWAIVDEWIDAFAQDQQH